MSYVKYKDENEKYKKTYEILMGILYNYLQIMFSEETSFILQDNFMMSFKANQAEKSEFQDLVKAIENLNHNGIKDICDKHKEYRDYRENLLIEKTDKRIQKRVEKELEKEEKTEEYEKELTDSVNEEIKMRVRQEIEEEKKKDSNYKPNKKGIEEKVRDKFEEEIKEMKKKQLKEGAREGIEIKLRREKYKNFYEEFKKELDKESFIKEMKERRKIVHKMRFRKEYENIRV